MRGRTLGWLWAAALSITVLAVWGVGSGGRVAGAAQAVARAQAPTRSLTPEEIRGLQEGEGMGLARAAEFNGYPGPSRILEAARAGQIEIYADQRQAIERILAAATSKAQALGLQILAQEAALEAGLRAGRMADADLSRQVEEIGQARAELRLTHLRAHLLATSLLRPEQIEEYYQFRGYVAPSSGYQSNY